MDAARRRVCLICQEEVVGGLEERYNSPGGAGERGRVHLKALLQFLKVDVSKVPVDVEGEKEGEGEVREGGPKKGRCWTEEDLAGVGICEECDYHVDAFGVKYSKEYEPALRKMKQCIVKVGERLNTSINTNNNNKGGIPPGGIIVAPAPPEDGLTPKYYNLKAEILKKCKLVMSSDGYDVGELSQVRNQESQTEEVFVHQEEQGLHDVREDKGMTDAMILDIAGRQEGGGQLNDFREEVQREEEDQEEQLELEGGQNSSSKLDNDQNDASISGKISTISVENQGGTAASKGVTSTSTTTTTLPIIEPRKCPHCGVSLRGPKSHEKRHLTVAHTFEHFAEHFVGFTPEHVDQGIRELCREVLLLPNDEKDTQATFHCNLCQTGGGRVKDSKFHVLTHHFGVLQSRLMIRQEGPEPPMNIVTGQGSQNRLALGEAVAPQQGQVGRSPGNLDDNGDRGEENSDDEMESAFRLCDIKQEQLDDQMEDDYHEQELDEQEDHFVEEGGSQEYNNMPGTDNNDLLGELEDDDLDLPTLEVPGYTCGYCDLFVPGHFIEVDKHMVLIHTAAYLTKRHRPRRSTTDKDLDRVLLGLCGRQGSLRTFRCSFCNKSISGQGKRHHFLTEHFQLVKQGLEGIGRGGQVEQVVNDSEQLRPLVLPAPDTPEIAEIPTTPTELTLTLQRQFDKADFDRNRKAYESDPRKPRFEYSFLIKQAIAESRNKRLKVSEICWWLRNNFGYFGIPRVKKTLRRRISIALSNGKCFVRVNPSVKNGEWKLKGREFYKAGRKWSSVPPPATPVTLPPPQPPVYMANVIIENLEEGGDASSFHQSSSSGNEQQQPPPPATQGDDFQEELADIQQNEGGDGANRNNGTPLEDPLAPPPQPASKCLNCHTANLDDDESGNMMMCTCVSTTVYISQQLARGTGCGHCGQDAADQVVTAIDDPSTLNSTTNTTGRSTESVQETEGDDSSSSSSIGFPTSNNFDVSLASSDLMVHIKQEKGMERMDEDEEQQEWVEGERAEGEHTFGES